MTAAVRHPKVPRPDPGEYLPWLRSWALSLQAASRSARTVTLYVDAVGLFAGWLRATQPHLAGWEQVTRGELRQFFAWLQTGAEGGGPCPHLLGPGAATAGCAGYGRGYVNNLARCLQQFFGWFSREEDLPNPCDDVELPSAPKPGEKLIPVISVEDLEALIRDAEKGRDFRSRRDAAMLRLFACTGMRLSELALLRVDDVNLPGREAVVTGKGRRQRTVKFDSRAALAIDRYQRERSKLLAARAETVTQLWVGRRRHTAMTASGAYQIIARRGADLGLKLHPHMFRHTFAHRWLDAGGAEGDLMELAGWDSPQMLRHYGASARSARARRAYDRIDVMGGV